MKLCTRVVLQLAALCLVLGASSFAADNSYLYIVNGIPGRDIAGNVNPAFPIDVLLNGESCMPRGLAFGTTNGPLSFPAGTYKVEISYANTLAPCTNAAIADTNVTLTSGGSDSVVAAIQAGQPTLLQFTDNLSPVTAGNARFVFVNSADAPELQATLTQGSNKFVVMAEPGKQKAITVPMGTYTMQVVAVGGNTVLATEQLVLANQSATLTYAAGEAANNILGLINRTVQEVF
jgi:hypothetical protein